MPTLASPVADTDAQTQIDDRPMVVAKSSGPRPGDHVHDMQALIEPSTGARMNVQTVIDAGLGSTQEAIEARTIC